MKKRDLDKIIDEAFERHQVAETKLTPAVLHEMIQEELSSAPLEEQQNTLAADVNEILLGYYCGGANWEIYADQESEVRAALEARRQSLTEEQYRDQDGRAEAEAIASLDWARANGFDGPVTQAWWTARPGVLARATGVDVQSRKNPTDVLLQFGSDAFLGISAKSTKGTGDIGFKNPGIGRLGREVGVDLAGIAGEAAATALKGLDFGDAVTTKERKAFLKALAGDQRMASAEATQPYRAAGALILKALRDALMEKYLQLDLDDLKEHFLEEWIDAKDRFPYYIKVTGHGNAGNYSASVEDPTDNDKVKKISSEHIELEEIGSNSIGVWAGSGADAARLFKIRLKWESAPLASSIKMSGDPWK